MSENKYADIIIPGALVNSYTYSLEGTSTDSIEVGTRIIVPFGKNRHLIGVVEKLHSVKPQYKSIKKVLGVPGYAPKVSLIQLKFWRWVSSYYMCTLGEIMDAALPSGLKLQQDKYSNSNETNIRYKPRVKPYVSFARDYSEDELNTLLNTLEMRAPARYRLITHLIEETSQIDNGENLLAEKQSILKKSGVSASILNALIKQNVLKIDMKEVPRTDQVPETRKPVVDLSSDQEIAYNSILGYFDIRDAVLLKGVTSSGKTEIYIHLIQEQLKLGKQVLYLLPEIALTTQIITRLKTYFGNDVGVYHSRFNDNERVEVWLRTGNTSTGNQYRIILGVRSSLFLPFENLGLIIIDEEHDASYKQKDPAPRYSARDSALILAKYHGAKVLLGSATPSVESVFNCQENKFGLVELNSRYGDVKMPELEIADTKEAQRRKIMISHFTPQLIRATEEAIERREQVVYFRNRRGYAPVLVCNECGWTPVCPDCSVNMTYHKGLNKLKCHYCGISGRVYTRCSNCGSSEIKMRGFGTEKIEDEISILFPDAKVSRMDLDSTRKKGSFEDLISRLEKGKIDILVGTQMISKGLDFENLTLVGVLNVDNMLFFPDFRAGERCFQLIEQVSGRAGRREKQGRVIIQTFDPHNTIIRQALNHDYWSMYNSQIDERKEFGYPPFKRLIKIYIKHKERAKVVRAADFLARSLRKNLELPILGPEFPVINRIQANYIMTILIKIDRKTDNIKLKHLIRYYMNITLAENRGGQLRIYADVDPV